MEEIHDFKESLEKLEEAVEKAAEDALQTPHLHKPHIKNRVVTEFYEIVKDPYRLPFFLHPFVGNRHKPMVVWDNKYIEETQFSRTTYSYSVPPPLEDEVSDSTEYQTLLPEYLGHKFYMHDDHGVERMINFTLKTDNFLTGAIGW